MIKKNSLEEDIDKRFEKEKKYVLDPETRKIRGRGMIIATSIIMILIVFISMMYTFISLGGINK